MNNQKCFIIRKIIVSLFICLYGICLMNIYEINFLESVKSSIDGLQKVISMVLGTDKFYVLIKDNQTFDTICHIFGEKYNDQKTTVYLILQLDIYKYISLFLLFIEIDYERDVSKSAKIVFKIINIITDFFLLFISGHIIFVIFDFLPNISYNSVKDYFMSIYYEIESNVFIVLMCAVFGVLLIILIWLLTVGIIIVELINILVLLAMFYIIGMFYVLDNLPLWFTMSSIPISKFIVTIWCMMDE